MLIKALVLSLFSLGLLSISFLSYFLLHQAQVLNPLPQTSLKTPRVLAQATPSSTNSSSSGLDFLANNSVPAVYEQVQHDSVEVFQAPTPTPLPTTTPTPNPTSTPTPIPTATPILLATSTPTPIVPTVAPTLPPSAAPSDLESLFSKYGTEYGVDIELLKKIARCESGMNTNATNGDYSGMFQFATSSWIATRSSMGQNTDPSLRFNAEEAIKTSAYKISKGGVGAWPNCSK